MYVPNHGGAFGQHGWNEVYMGEAGWIPLDATANETGYLDSGHIRIGIHEVAATALNPISFEVLDHRVGIGAEPPVEPGKYEAYVGEYSHQAAGKTFAVIVQNGSLAVDIPGQLVVVLNEPDDQGRWYAKISPGLFFTFKTDAEDRAVIYEDGRLAIVNPLENVTVGLQAPDQHGRRLDEYGKNTVWFEEDDGGGVRAMAIDAATRFVR